MVLVLAIIFIVPGQVTLLLLLNYQEFKLTDKESKKKKENFYAKIAIRDMEKKNLEKLKKIFQKKRKSDLH